MLGKNFSVKEIFTALLFGILIFAAATWLSLNLIAKNIYQEQEQAGKKLLQYISKIDYEIQKGLQTLNSLDFNTCNEATLKEMRKASFKTKHVKDFGFFDDKTLLCTTLIGVLKKPFTGKNIPDFIGDDGTRIWADIDLILFEEKYSAIIIRKGKYNTVLDNALLKEYLELDYQWRLNYRAGAEKHYFAGQHSLNTTPPDTLWWRIIKSYVPIFESCSNNSPHCIELFISNEALETRQTFFLDMILIWCLFLGFIVAFLVLKIFTWNKSLQRRIINAYKAGQFYCRYQPIVDLASKKIVGVEVLARLQDRYGTIPPQQFIPIIRQANMCWRFTKSITELSLKELSTLPRINKNFEANINIFPTDIINPAIRAYPFIESVTQYPGVIHFDIQESSELGKKEARENIKLLQDLNIRVSIDNFGTGFSDIKLLKKIQFNQIKIDRTVTKDIDQKSIRASLVPHIINIAKELNKTILAEGIETKEQLNILTNLGVQRGQGWFLGKPMNIKKLIQTVEENRISTYAENQKQANYY
jgi:sensor c-di-GMP phosphodiesterase-like protein